jgi:putative nucleotidyltransferase with HDIG domain
MASLRGNEGRWAGRPVLANGLFVVAHLVPIAAAVATSAVVSRHLAAPRDAGDAIGRWTLLLGVSTVALVAVDRIARRALPLAALLKLSMVFPDHAPKRLAVARRSGGSLRDLEERIAEAKALGEADEPARAAEVILSLVGALHGHDRRTRGHSERVRWFADLIAAELRLPDADRDRLRWAALLHDIGKLRVHRRILGKPSALTQREWAHIHRHPEEGARIAAPLADWLGPWADTIAQHHERYDGSGYPYHLRGDDISLGARIVAVADAYEVMTGARAYKRPMSAAEARAELTKCAGTHFDPVIVRAFLTVSIGRLRWVAGPAAWLAQLPFIGWLPRLADGAAAFTGQAAGVVGAAAGAAAISASAVSPASSLMINNADDMAPSNPPTLLDLPTPSQDPLAIDANGGAAYQARSAGGAVVLGLQLIAPPTGAEVDEANGGAGAGGAAPTTTTTVVPGKGQANGLVDRTTAATDTATATATTDKVPKRDTAPGISGRSGGGNGK